MARTGSADTVVLGERRRTRLEAMVARATTAQRVVLRAKIVLAAWRGRSNAAIAAALGITVDTVRKWRHRFVVNGMAGLHDRPRPGRPAIYGLDAQLLIVATVTQVAPQVDSHWTHRLLAHHLAEPLGISASQIGRILAALDLKPHRVRGWLNRPEDPAFAAKAQAVCALYLKPPADAVLFSVDEKTAMQARSRKRASVAVRRGRPELREFEYVRHGTASLIAAMNVTNGTVHPKIIVANNSATFTEFLTELAATVDPAKRIHLILDNGSSHTSKATKLWLAEHPRFTVTYTPVHASWLNMVEIFFSILARRVLRRGDFASRQDLINKILAFIQAYNLTAKPFRWTYDAKLLRAA